VRRLQGKYRPAGSRAKRVRGGGGPCAQSLATVMFFFPHIL